MDFHAMTRKELQTLCKNSGIPANRSNAFMADALANKRIPLSQMDANKGMRLDPSTEGSSKHVGNLVKSPYKAAPLAKQSTARMEPIGVTTKPPLYSNNFLRKGKRKDVTENNAVSQRPDAGIVPAQEKKVKPEISATPCGPDLITSAGARGEKKLKSGTHPGSATAKDTKEVMDILEDVGAASSHDTALAAKVRSQIEASLISKVMNPPARRRSAAPSVVAAAVPQEKKVKADISATPSGPDLIASAEARGDETLKSGAHRDTATAKEVKVITGEVGAASSHDTTLAAKVRSQVDASLISKVMNSPDRFPSAAPLVGGSSEMSLIDSQVSSEIGEGVNLPSENDRNQQKENCPSPVVSPACTNLRLKGEDVSASSPRPQTTSSQLIESSPQLSFTPLRQMEDKVQSILDRCHSFWGASDIAVLKSFGSLA